MSDGWTWKPGFRHHMTLNHYGPGDWRCLDCDQTFETWPSDDMECPGPPKDRRVD